MTREIDIGGRQGRGNPRLGLGEDGTLIDLDITKPAEVKHSVWGDLATGAGLLADDSYGEPETRDLSLPELTTLEIVLIRVALIAASGAMLALIVSCIN
jgi:hypothetical protein